MATPTALPRLAGIVLVLVAVPALLGPVPASAAPPAARAPAGPLPAARWAAPLSGPPAVVRGFDPPPERFSAGHRGVDLAGLPGDVVLSAGDGVVLFAGTVAGRPVVSVVHGGGLRTTYEPVTPSVHAGQSVARGTALGTLLPGHPGCGAAACLHWGLRRGETYLDPLLLFRPTRVRLLPWPDG